MARSELHFADWGDSAGQVAVAQSRIPAHCLAPGRAAAPPGQGGRYGRMFDLPPLEADESLLHRIGAAGGFCDGGNCTEDAKVEAGWPFFGQFIAHDLTADRSPLRNHADVSALRNMRSPVANLDSLYGNGPVGSPYLYRRDDPSRLLDADGDLPRNQEGIALIGDPRNDTHSFMNQIHVRFIDAHNLLIDRLREDGIAEASLFAEARRALIWHYQWLIVNEFLPALIGAELVDELETHGPRFYRPDSELFIPLEFADAAFRYGHSQIRQLYQLRPAGDRFSLFPDLLGFGPIGERQVDWALLFDVPGQPPAQRAKPMDGLLPRSLIELPQAITGDVEEAAYHSLAARDLERGQGTALPSGESVAELIGSNVLTDEELDLRRHGWTGETPLWLYVLREAHTRHEGDRLGEVGGRIVGEVLYSVIAGDPESYLTDQPAWQPTLPARAERFKLIDILAPRRF